MTINPAARFQVDPVPINAPGNCFICKSVNGPVIRTGLRNDYYREKPDASRDGNVYICAACVKDMYNTLAVTTPDTVNMLDARRAGVNYAISSGKKLIDDFAANFASLIYSECGVVIDDSGTIDVSSTEDSKDNDENSGDSGAKSQEHDKTDEQGVKSSIGEGPSDLPDAGSDANLFAGIK